MADGTMCPTDKPSCNEDVISIASAVGCLATVICILLVCCIIRLKRYTNESSFKRNAKEIYDAKYERVSAIQMYEVEKKKKEMALQKYEAERRAKETETRRKIQTIERYEAEKKENIQALKKYEVIRREKNQALQRYEDEKKQKNEALQRLSRMMSDRLTKGNPNIANLSDMKRPTKLAEEFSELYDNTWTDALECIGDSHEHKETVQFLLQILKVSFCWCKDRSNDQLKKLNGLLSNPGELVDKTDTIHLNKDFVKTFKDERKRVAVQSAANIVAEVTKDVKAHFQQSAWKDAVQAKPVDAFCTECIKLCWFFVVQDPSMDIDFVAVRRYDFRPFTQNGKVIDFVVWPPLYMCAGGNLVSKGVAQFH